MWLYLMSSSSSVVFSFKALAKAIAPSFPNPLSDMFRTLKVWLDYSRNREN